MYPLFLYLMTVMVHTPTAKMYFYNCPGTGIVQNYSETDQHSFDYLVEFKCPGGAVVKEWLPETHLREVLRK